MGIAQLLLVPARLCHFTLNTPGIRGMSDSWSPMLESLVAHKATLKSFTLGGLLVSQLTDLGNNVLWRELAALETLTLPRVMEELPAVEFGNCLPPNLSRIETHYGRDCYTFFSARSERWLRDLLRTAISRKVPISCVYIQHGLSVRFRDGRAIGPTPDNWVRQTSALFFCLLTFLLPWDYLAGLATEFWPYGIQIQFDEPTKTKNEIQREIDAYEAALDRDVESNEATRNQHPN